MLPSVERRVTLVATTPVLTQAGECWCTIHPPTEMVHQPDTMGMHQGAPEQWAVNVRVCVWLTDNLWVLLW